MSEVQSRPAPAQRGRGSARGGRGGSFGARSGGFVARGARPTNGFQADDLEEQGEVGQLLKKYANELGPLKEMFPDWTSADIVYALEENEGDVQMTAEKISEGHASQWGEVKKKKNDRSRSKATEPVAPAHTANSFGAARGARTSYDGAIRGGRGRGGFEQRGGRGGRGGFGGRGGAPVNGARPIHKAPDAPAPANAWDNNNSPAEDAQDVVSSENAWGAKPEKKEEETDKVPAPAGPKPAAPAVPSWASLLKPAPPPPKPVQQKPAPPPKPAPEPVVETPKEPEPEPTVVEEVPEKTSEPTPEVEATPVEEPQQPDAVEEPATPAVEPEQEAQPQKLTEDNLEKIEDVAPPAPTGTAASTVASNTEVGTETSTTPAAATAPVTIAPAVPKPQAPVSKGTPGRAAFRRVLDQQEGVVMPANHADVTRTALQFGSMGLNGDVDDDEEPEPAETVAQPPQPSPLPQPVTSLPPTGPAAQQQFQQPQQQQLPTPQQPAAEHVPTPRQAPGLPSQPQNAPFPSATQPPLGPSGMTHQHIQPQYSQYSRFGAPEPQQKAFETFGQQQTPTQAPTQPQQQTPQQPTQPQSYGYGMPQQPSHLGGIGVSSAPEQVQYNYYQTDRSQPPGFGQQYGSAYMQSQLQSQQEAGAAQQRASSGLGGATDPVQIPSSVAGPGQVQQPTSRYGAQPEQGSGHATPSPALAAQQTHQSMAGQQGYPMQYHPYYNQFMHQNYYSTPNPYGGKGMFAYPQQYGMPTYADHSSSPGSVSGFGQPAVQGRDTMGSGLSDYNRMNAASSQQGLPQHSSASYGNGIQSNFLGSRLPQDQQQLGGAGVQQQVQQGQSDDMKFGENKPPTGPSSAPSLQGQPGRPGSATSGASGLGPQQGNQGPGGMYSSHLNPSLHNQGQQQHQQQQQYGVGQGQAANQYSMYGGGYPAYPQGNRHGGNSGWAYGH